MPIALAAALALSLAPAGAPACALAPADRAWLDGAVRAWTAARTRLLRAPAPDRLSATVFDRGCALSSDTALRGGTAAEAATWTAAPIAGGAIMVGGQRIPVGVMSAAIGDEAGARFVMSTPSLWAAGGVTPGPLGLPTLMTAVLIHEATHVFQMHSYGAEVAAIQQRHRLANADFHDDAIQARFEREPAFAAGIARETALLFDAAEAADADAARCTAAAARAMMRARAARWFVGDQAYQVRAEALWLTMEGTGQWAGYRWLRMPRAQGGAGIDAATAMAGFGRRGRSWTQLLGLALALTVERIGPRDWRARVFGDGRATLPELLDAALAAAPARDCPRGAAGPVSPAGA